MSSNKSKKGKKRYIPPAIKSVSEKALVKDTHIYFASK